MTDRLRSELPNMLAEHARIVEALEQAGWCSGARGQPTGRGLRGEVKLHAQTEEQVLYPAAIVHGDYVRLKLNK